MKNRFVFLYFTGLLLAFAQCGNKNNTVDDQIPFITVDKYYNVFSPTYISLSNPGGWIVDSTAGVRGIFILKNFNNDYKAFDLNCSYHPLDKCSKLTVDSSGLFLKCGQYVTSTWQPCCDSRFSIDGAPTKAPANRVLRAYQTTFDGSVLHVFN